MLMASIVNKFRDTRMVGGQFRSNKSSDEHLLIHSYLYTLNKRNKVMRSN